MGSRGSSADTTPCSTRSASGTPLVGGKRPRSLGGGSEAAPEAEELGCYHETNQMWIDENVPLIIMKSAESLGNHRNQL